MEQSVITRSDDVEAIATQYQSPSNKVKLVVCPLRHLYNDCALLVGFIGFVVPILVYRAEQNLVFCRRAAVGGEYSHKQSKSGHFLGLTLKNKVILLMRSTPHFLIETC